MPVMPEIVMPDQSALNYPAEFRFSAAIEIYYRLLPYSLRRNWDLYGSESIVGGIPKTAAVHNVKGAARARIKNYEEATARLARIFLDLQDMDGRLADQVRTSVIAARRGRADLEAVIRAVNADAGTIPVGMSKGDHILASLTAGLDRVNHIVTDTTRTQHAYAESIHGLATQLTEPRPSLKPTSTTPVSSMTTQISGRDRTQARERPSRWVDAPGPHTTAQAPLRVEAADPVAGVTPQRLAHQASSADSVELGATSRHWPQNLTTQTTGHRGHSPRATAGTDARTQDAGIRRADHNRLPPEAAPNVASTPWGYRNGGTSSGPQPVDMTSSTWPKGELSGQSPALSTDEHVTYGFPASRTQEVLPAVARVPTEFHEQWAPNTRSATTVARAPVTQDSNMRGEPDAVMTDDVDSGERDTAERNADEHTDSVVTAQTPQFDVPHHNEVKATTAKVSADNSGEAVAGSG